MLYAMVRVGADLGLFRTLAANSKTFKLEELAVTTGSTPELLGMSFLPSVKSTRCLSILGRENHSLSSLEQRNQGGRHQRVPSKQDYTYIC